MENTHKKIIYKNQKEIRNKIFNFVKSRLPKSVKANPDKLDDLISQLEKT